MCVVIAPAVMMGISAAMTAAGAIVQHQQASASADAQTKALKQRQDLQEADLARQQQAQTEAGAAQMNVQARNAWKDAALFDTISGEFGGGVSNTRAGASMGIKQGEALATIDKNSSNAAIQNSFQGLELQSQTNSQLASISRPSMFGTALTIGSAVVNGMQAHAASKASAASTAKSGGINK